MRNRPLAPWLIAVTLVTRAAVGAQTPPPSPTPAAAATFEVASVRPSSPEPGPFGQVPRVLPPVNGRFTAQNVPLRLLIRLAYGVQDFQLAGGPEWLASARYDIAAKAEDGGGRTMDAVLPMVRALLADRFRLRTHTENRDLPVFDLVVARDDRRLGPSLRTSTADCSHAQADQQKRLEALARGGPAALAALVPKPGEVVPCAMSPLVDPTNPAGGFGLRASGMPVGTLTALLTSATGRTVRDKTGLSGPYDWELVFDPQVMLGLAAQAGVNLPAGVTLPPSDSPSLLTALREQLGLKLDSTRGPVEVLIIDRIEMPTPD